MPTQNFYRLLLLTSISLFICSGLTAQTANISKDSLVANKVKWLRQNLSLSDEQSGRIKKILLSVNKRLDSLSGAKLSLEKRGPQLQHINEVFNRQLKNTLSTEQWVQYQQLEAANNEAIKRHALEKKIAVKTGN